MSKILIFLSFFFALACNHGNKSGVDTKKSDTLTDSLHIVEKDGKIFVNEKGRQTSLNFILQNHLALTSYVVEIKGNKFDVLYEFSGSVKKSYLLVTYKWDDRRLFMMSSALLKNNAGDWSGYINFDDKSAVLSFDDIQARMFPSPELEIEMEKNSGIILARNGEWKGESIAIPKGFSELISIDETDISPLLKEAEKIIKL